MKIAVVRLVLLARCVTAAALLWQVATRPPGPIGELVRAQAALNLVDGALGVALAVSVAALKWEHAIVAVAAVDGLVRLLAGLTLRFAPGIPDLLLTLMIYGAAVVGLAVGVGILEVLTARALERRSGRSAVSRTLWGLGVVSVVGGVVAFASGFEPALTRGIMLVGSAAQAAAMATLLLAVRGLPERHG